MRILILLLLTLTQLLSYDNRFTPEENLWMKEHPIVTYVGDPSWLPYEGYDKTQNYIGLVPDLLQLASNNVALTFKHIDTKTWQESLTKITTHSVMMISQSHVSNKSTNLNFTKSYLEDPIVIVMQKGEKYVASIYQIRHKKIGLINNSTTTPLFQKRYNAINFYIFASAQEGLEAVATGKVDAFLCSLPRAGYLIGKKQLNNLRIVGKSKIATKLGLGISKNDPILLAIMNKLITNVSEAQVQATLAKWSRQKYLPKPDYTALKFTSAAFIFIVILGVVFYLRLRHESQARIHAQNIMLQQQSKMASMGEMMDAVAHQWKQPLNALSMYSDLMKSDFEEGNVDKKYVDEMLEGVQLQIHHMTSTLSEFRNFFRPNTTIENFKLLALVESVLFLVKDEFLKNNINVELNIDTNILLHGNKNEFKHLILNIINNAKDAFNSQNTPQRSIIIQAKQNAKEVIITISDNAGGIPLEVIDHVFEANVTTKEAEAGTGIGLYMSAQIVEKMQGHIKVDNLFDGAVFTITL